MPASKLGWSVLGTYLSCQRKCYYENVLKLRSKIKPIFFSKGEIWHEFMAHHYLGTLNSYDQDALIRDQIALGASFEPIDYEHLEHTAQYYIDQFASYQVVDVEKDLIIDLGGNVPYTVRLDLLAVNSRDELEYIDHKTGARNDSKKNLNHGALTGYWIACKKSNYDISRVVINQIVWASKGADGVVQYTQVPPVSTTKSQKECDTWIRQKAIKVMEYLTKVANAKDEKDILNPDSWHKNEDMCYHFSPCKFNILCKYEVNIDTINMIFRVGDED